MHVLYIVESLSSKGGAENALMTLISEMKKKGQESSIVTLWGDNDFRDLLNREGVRVLPCNLGSRWQVVKGAKVVLSAIKNEKPDIINAINFFPMVYCAISSLFNKTSKSVVTYHNMGYEVYPAETFLKKVRKFFDSMLNRFLIDRHLAVSNAVANSYGKHLNIKSIEVIPNIIPVQKIINMVSDGSKVPIDLASSSNVTLIAVGRLVMEKNYSVSFEALDLLRERGVMVKLDVYGEGPLKNQLERELEEKNLSSIVRIHDTVPHPVLFEKIANASMLIMPSISEGLPMALAEAMVIGTPIIATDVGGIPELIEDEISGLLIPSNDPLALAKAIEKLNSEETLRKTIIKEARNKILKEYGPDSVAEKLKRFYEEMIR